MNFEKNLTLKHYQEKADAERLSTETGPTAPANCSKPEAAYSASGTTNNVSGERTVDQYARLLEGFNGTAVSAGDLTMLEYGMTSGFGIDQLKDIAYAMAVTGGIENPDEARVVMQAARVWLDNVVKDLEEERNCIEKIFYCVFPKLKV